MCYLIQKHVYIHFFNNQKLLILFNRIDVNGGKSLVKPWLFLSFIDQIKPLLFLREELLEGSVINIKLI